MGFPIKHGGQSRNWIQQTVDWNMIEVNYGEKSSKPCLIWYMGVSENVVYPIVPNGFADHYPVFKWLFHWEYTLFPDKPICLDGYIFSYLYIYIYIYKYLEIMEIQHDETVMVWYGLITRGYLWKYHPNCEISSSLVRSQRLLLNISPRCLCFCVSSCNGFVKGTNDQTTYLFFIYGCIFTHFYMSIINHWTCIPIMESVSFKQIAG